MNGFPPRRIMLGNKYSHNNYPYYSALIRINQSYRRVDSTPNYDGLIGWQRLSRVSFYLPLDFALFFLTLFIHF